MITAKDFMTYLKSEVRTSLFRMTIYQPWASLDFYLGYLN